MMLASQGLFTAHEMTCNKSTQLHNALIGTSSLRTPSGLDAHRYGANE